ncbi:conserved membrane protein, unknown function [Hepatocystis sp. ex Piliocolobus tephrosceles]|nr:conserved membrane protein, unknown function [Hepatocystis sp. ex Piliocolobus tephrosceles]
MNEIKKYDILNTLFTIFLILIQQVFLSFIIYFGTNNYLYFLLGFLDLFLCLYIICGISDYKNSGVKVSIQWMLYMVTLSIKLVIYCFFMHENNNDKFDSSVFLYLSRDMLAYNLIYLTPFIYLLFLLRSKNLLENIFNNKIINDYILCIDMNIINLFDIIDLVYMYTHLTSSYKIKTIWAFYNIDFTFVMIILILCIMFLIGFYFPIYTNIEKAYNSNEYVTLYSLNRKRSQKAKNEKNRQKKKKNIYDPKIQEKNDESVNKYNNQIVLKSINTKMLHPNESKNVNMLSHYNGKSLYNKSLTIKDGSISEQNYTNNINHSNGGNNNMYNNHGNKKKKKKNLTKSVSKQSSSNLSSISKDFKNKVKTSHTSSTTLSLTSSSSCSNSMSSSSSSFSSSSSSSSSSPFSSSSSSSSSSPSSSSSSSSTLSSSSLSSQGNSFPSHFKQNSSFFSNNEHGYNSKYNNPHFQSYKDVYTDIYITAKFHFIVGFLLIDVPFLIYRLIFFIKYKNIMTLIIKNILFLLFRSYKLNEYRFMEKEKHKKNKRNINLEIYNTSNFGSASTDYIHNSSFEKKRHKRHKKHKKQKNKKKLLKPNIIGFKSKSSVFETIANAFKAKSHTFIKNNIDIELEKEQKDKTLNQKKKKKTSVRIAKTIGSKELIQNQNEKKKCLFLKKKKKIKNKKKKKKRYGIFKIFKDEFKENKKKLLLDKYYAQNGKDTGNKDIDNGGTGNGGTTNSGTNLNSYSSKKEVTYLNKIKNDYNGNNKHIKESDYAELEHNENEHNEKRKTQCCEKPKEIKQNKKKRKLKFSWKEKRQLRKKYRNFINLIYKLKYKRKLPIYRFSIKDHLFGWYNCFFNNINSSNYIYFDDKLVFSYFTNLRLMLIIFIDYLLKLGIILFFIFILLSNHVFINVSIPNKNNSNLTYINDGYIYLHTIPLKQIKDEQIKFPTSFDLTNHKSILLPKKDIPINYINKNIYDDVFNNLFIIRKPNGYIKIKILDNLFEGTWKDIFIVDKICIYSCIIYFILFFVLFLKTSTFFDILYVAIFNTISYLSFYFSIKQVVLFFCMFNGNIYNKDYIYINSSIQKLNTHYEYYLLLFFNLHYCISFIKHIVLFFCVIFNLKYVYNDRRRSLKIGGNANTRVRYSTSVYLLFLLCKYSYAPINLNTLLLGKNILNNILLIDNINMYTWINIAITVLFKCIQILIIKINYFLIALFLLHIILYIIYAIHAQILRYIILRKIEILYTFKKIIISKHQEIELVPYKYSPYITCDDLIKYYSEEGFFSAESNIIPIFI